MKFLAFVVATWLTYTLFCVAVGYFLSRIVTEVKVEHE